MNLYKLRNNFIRQFSSCSVAKKESRIDVYQEKSAWREDRRTADHVREEKSKSESKLYDNLRVEMLFKFPALRRILWEKGGMSEWWTNYVRNRKLWSQSFSESRFHMLGPDLAVAHFVIYRGGLVKFWNINGWIGNRSQKIMLPNRYLPGYYIEGIDARHMDLHYEGVDCLRELSKLKYLNLKGSVNINDFALDILSGRYGDTLEYLDLSGCKGITHYGLSSMYRFTKLKILDLSDISHTSEFKLACLSLLDVLPDLEIIGVDFPIKAIIEG